MVFEPSNGNAIVDDERARESVVPASVAPQSASPLTVPESAEPALAFATSIDAAREPSPAAFGPTALLDAHVQGRALIEDPASQMDAAFAELDELNPPDFRRSFRPRALVERLPRWACFVAGIGLGVVVTLIAT